MVRVGGACGGVAVRGDLRVHLVGGWRRRRAVEWRFGPEIVVHHLREDDSIFWKRLMGAKSCVK